MILIGVALFAALSYTVVDMIRGGDSAMSISEEKAGIYASEIIDYARTVRQVVQELRIDGCDDTEISFENPVVVGYTNGTNTACQVFHMDGGALSWQKPPEPFTNISLLKTGSTNSDYIFTNNRILKGAVEVGTSESDLLMILPITGNFCAIINEKLGNSNESEDPGIHNISMFTGGYSSSNEISSTNYTQGCFCDRQAGGSNLCNAAFENKDHYFFQVLIAR
ncbi:hypothetical protein N9Z27_01235 [Alphaproteobacteria bacterium]|nr:hypothetical protein [Alphaproteobacteria bacterium]